MEAGTAVIEYVFTFNPIALIKAKIVCNFGLSECNRVNSEPEKCKSSLYTSIIFAILQRKTICDYHLWFVFLDNPFKRVLLLREANFL